MEKIRTLIIDDERLARKELISLLATHEQIEIVGECSDAVTGIEAIKNEDPDLVFLDIQMPGKDGFQMLEEIEKMPDIIFVTAYDEYAIKAFEVNALDYLLKPVNENRLNEAILKFTSDGDDEIPLEENDEALTENDQVFVKDGDKCWFVHLRDIRLFESEGNYIRVYFENYRPMILKSLNNLEKRLDDRVFFRASRKHIINLKWIDKTENWFNGGLMVELRGGQRVQISRRQASKLKEKKSL